MAADRRGPGRRPALPQLACLEGAFDPALPPAARAFDALDEDPFECVAEPGPRPAHPAPRRSRPTSAVATYVVAVGPGHAVARAPFALIAS